MRFIDTIFSFVWDIATAVYAAYSEVSGWVWPFNYLQYPLYALYRGVWGLLTPLANFGNWVTDIAAKIGNILSWGTIWSYILSYIPNLAAIRDWFYAWWTNVTSVVVTWWSAAQNIVQVWVQSARDHATALFIQVGKSLAGLQTAWDDFKSDIPALSAVRLWWGSWWANILVPLTAWWNSRLSDIYALINSTLRSYEPFWSGWQDWRAQVAEFFTDPEEWLYKAVDRIIERFW